MTNSQTDTRREVADALTALLLKVADDYQIEQTELRKKFPTMLGLPPALDVDPDMIRDFTESGTYKQALQDYVTHRTEENLVVTVLRLLRALLPMAFGAL